MRPSSIFLLAAATIALYSQGAQAQTRQQVQNQARNALKALEKAQKQNDAEVKNWEKQTLAELDQRMGFTAPQKKSAEQIVSDGARSIQRLNQNPQIAGLERREQLEQIYSTIWARAAALLSPDQLGSLTRKDQADKLVTDLGLTDPQAQQLDDLLAQLDKDIAKLRKSKTVDPADQDAQIRELDSAAWAKFDATLTSGQLTLLDKSRADDMVAAYAAKLQMSKKQAEQTLPPALVAVTAMRQIRSQTGLSAAEKSTQIAAVKSQFREKIRPLLSPEQQRLMEALATAPSR